MININMNKAKDIWRDKIREERKELFTKYDIEYIKALENGHNELQKDIAQKKQLLRDAPSDPRIHQAQSIEELKSIDPINDPLSWHSIGMFYNMLLESEFKV